MSAEARSAIFARLRGACSGAGDESIEAAYRALGQATAAAAPAAESCEAFLINVLRNQGTADWAGNRSDTVKAVAQYLMEHFRSQRLVAGNDPRLAALPWRDAGLLPRFGSTEPGEPVALSYAQLGVVETGAVVTRTGKGNPAANNLLPERHIVIVDRKDLVDTMEQAWERLAAEMRESGRPRGINFIAGPSSTADIEGQLVYGAHGPRAWHVILVGEVPDGALERARAGLAAG